MLRLDSILGSAKYHDLDIDTARTMLDEVARLAEGPVAESFADADRNPPAFDPEHHIVIVPAELAKSVQAVKNTGWWRVGIAEDVGGVPAPAPLTWAINDMLLCANPSAGFFWALGPAMAHALAVEGTDEQRRWAAVGLERGWSATMVLTEPDAGSDVGAGRAKAIAQPDGTWHIEGVKRFISGGDVGETAENIFHLVLARPEGAAAGTKGLSLFYVPKYLFDPETFELGPRNGVFATGLEHKMGLKSSPTCELTFGAHGLPAVGYLVGDVHNGIAQMFTVIEHARMTIGVKAAGTLSTGYLNALAFAKERVQDADMTQMTDKTAPRVTIIHHPDVRRSLMTQNAYAEGLRALYMYAAAHQDGAVAQQVSGADPQMATVSTICCCRSSRAWDRNAPAKSSPSHCRRWADPASCRTIRSSSTSATPRSTPPTRAPPQFRRWTSSSARSSATAARRWRMSRPSSLTRSRTATRRCGRRPTCFRPR